jgi:hypothetical protein
MHSKGLDVQLLLDEMTIACIRSAGGDLSNRRSKELPETQTQAMIPDVTGLDNHMRPEQRLVNQQSLQQERSYADVCVPELIQLATQNKDAIAELIAGLPPSWPFADKVLVAVFPSFRADVEAFLAGTGKPMTEMFDSHQLPSVDNGARLTLLAKLADRLRIPPTYGK